MFNLYMQWLYKRVLHSDAGLKAKENQSYNSSPKPKQPNKTVKWQEVKL